MKRINITLVSLFVVLFLCLSFTLTVTDKAGFGLVFRAETVSEALDLFG
jgi:hypothetical protein